MNKTVILAALFLFSLALSYASSQQKKIYIAADDHTDYMWSGDEKEYREAFLSTLDYYIKLNDSTANEPYPYQSKWNCDGSYWVYEYMKNRSPEQFAKLIEQIRSGKITVPLNTLAGVHGIAPLEVTLRDMYYAGSLERKYNLNLELAINMEDQVLPLGLSSLWAGSGAKYSWRGVCACATKVTGLENRPHEIYWYQGLDDRKVLMKWYSVNPSMITRRKEYRYYLGTYLEASNPVNAIEDCKVLMNSPRVYPYNIAAAFGKGGDDLKTLTNKFPEVARSKSDASYQVIVSNELDFFKDFEKTYGPDLPSETVSYGSTEWGNSIASLAEVSATVKRSIEKLRSAEAMSVIISLKDKEFAKGLEEKREKAWIACGLYFEHDWTSDGKIITRKQRADWQRKIAAQLSSYVDTLYDLSIAELGKLIKKSGKGGEVFFVFNSLSWMRTDYSDYPYNGSANIRVVDAATSLEVPFQLITKKGSKYIRILAKEIPSLGFKIYEIRMGPSSEKFIQNISVTDSTIENLLYRIAFSKQGVITSLKDKNDNNRECITPVNNLYANDLGSGKGNSGLLLRAENAGPVSATLVAESYRPVKHTTKLTLFEYNGRIELENYITQNINEKPVTYSFSFNLRNPDIWHEEAGAILKAKPQSAGGNYADSICRLDWLAMNHFADMSDGNNGIVISNRDAFFMKTGNSTVSALDYTTPQIRILAGGQIDAPDLGILNQDGDSYFENFLALKPCNNGFDAATDMKFSLEHQNPLVAGRVSGNQGVYSSQFSLFSVNDPGVIVWAVKPAEEGIGNGIILRVWNMNDQKRELIISSFRPVTKCYSTTHIETNISGLIPENGKLKLSIGHNRIETFRVYLGI